ncbi:MAG: tetratricopeptide repeat protein [Chloroflexota bacterium]
MSARALPATGQAAAEGQLLAQLGLPPSAAPEDVDQIHEAVSEYLAAAPASIRGWAHAQSAALDAAYLQLTDPVGLQGSALRSPTRPPRVVPGGPATPPARRDSLPTAPPPIPDELDDEDAGVEADDDDVAALYAAVTPSAHADMGPDRRRSTSRKARRRAAAQAAVLPQQPPRSDPWKKVALGVLSLGLVALIAFTGYTLGGGGSNPGGTGTAEASPTVPLVDEAKVAGLMAQLQANPKDTAVLLALADEYYNGGQYETAATFLDKLLAIDPEHIKALLARGAVSFNLDQLDAAEATWQQVVALDPDNQEVHYDLGFLYLNQATPDWAGVQREWNRVIEIDPTTSLAQTAKQHLDSLVASSMIPASPAPSAAASPDASPAASADTGASPATSPAASPAASAAASPAASVQP